MEQSRQGGAKELREVQSGQAHTGTYRPSWRLRSFSERVKGATGMATVEEGLDVALMCMANGLGEKRTRDPLQLVRGGTAMEAEVV